MVWFIIESIKSASSTVYVKSVRGFGGNPAFNYIYLYPAFTILFNDFVIYFFTWSYIYCTLVVKLTFKFIVYPSDNLTATLVVG